MQQESKFNRFVMISALLHGSLFAVIFLGPVLMPAQTTESWGSETGVGESIRVGVVESLPGIPLPSPEIVSETAAQADSETLHPPEPAAKPIPVAAVAPDVLIPAKTADKPKPEPPVKTAAPAATAPATSRPPSVPVARAADPLDAPAAPSNAVPGDGGRAAVPYGQNGTGTGAASFGDEAFGRRFGTYVTAMTNAIREKWQQPPTARTTAGKPPRVYVTFNIERDGKVTDLKIELPSGDSRLDTSGQRAVLAARLPPLPSEYRGSNVGVRFYFEYGR